MDPYPGDSGTSPIMDLWIDFTLAFISIFG